MSVDVEVVSGVEIWDVEAECSKKCAGKRDYEFCFKRCLENEEFLDAYTVYDIGI